MRLFPQKIVLVTSIVLAASFMASAEPPIHLKQGSFSPGESTSTLQSQTAGVKGDYMLLQFREPTDAEYRGTLSSQVEFKSYIPENAWIVKLKGQRSEVVSKKKVLHLVPYKPQHRVSPRLKELEDVTVKIRVTFFKSAKEPEKLLEKYGEVEGRYAPRTWELNAEASQIEDIAQEKHVEWIAAKPPEPTTFNEEARKLIEAESLQEAPYNLTGEGFTAGIWDGGRVDNHSDLNYTGKLFIGEDVSISDHAVHVAGTLAGKGNVNNAYIGVAPDTSIASYDFDFATLSEFYNEIDDSMITYSANISQNSWGWDISSLGVDYLGDYAGLADEYDEVVRGRTPNVSDRFPVVFSAGNEGDRTPRYNTTTGPGGTAKNTITVGAVDDTGDMTSYSSWGPTDDGRIKPTVVADGGCGDNTAVTSTLPNNGYGTKCGTSMAAPAVSGTALLLYEKFNKSHGEIPEPSTIKAMLIHTATDLNSTGPDYATGWGLVNATEAVEYTEEASQKDLIKTRKLSDKGDLSNFTVSVPKGQQVNFTLVWNDYPGTSASGKALINDLDLVVRDSSGERKYPWTLSWENRTEPALQSQEDHKNTVEKVTFTSTETEEYTVVVNATKLPEPPQNYSLLMPDTAALNPGLDVVSPKDGDYVEMPDFNLSSDEPIKEAVFSINGTGNKSMKEKNSTYYYNNTLELEDNRWEATFYANNTNNFTFSERVSFSLDTKSPNLSVEAPVEQANLSGSFSIEANWGDNFAGVKSHNFTISNSTYSTKGALNSTFDSSNLADGDYNITYNVTDRFGNFNNTEIYVKIDNEKPSFNFYSPKDTDAFDTGIDIEAAWKDSLTGVETANYTFENKSFSDSGLLNGSVSSSVLGESSYNLTFMLKDFAGNIRMKRVEVFYDTIPPNLSVSTPKDNSFVKANFSVNATFKDYISGVVEANYSVSNSTKVLAGKLNDTLDTSNLSDSEYNITFKAADAAGNVNKSTVNVTLDSVPPNVSLEEPQEGETLVRNFSIKATYSDNTGIDDANFSVFNDSLQDSGSLNATLNSSKFADGSYSISANVSDRAGNLNFSKVSVKLDNSPPEVKSSTVVKNDNVSGTIDVNFTLSEATGLQTSEFRWMNGSGNATNWLQMNYTGLDTNNFSDGSYNLSVRLNDTLGNYRQYNITSIEIDNTQPNLGLKEYNLTEEREGWIKDNKTVQANCTDTGSGFKQVSVAGQSKTEALANFTLKKSGKNSYSFSCSDHADNTADAVKTFKIDAEAPELESLAPTEGSTTERSVDVKGELFNESKESGLNISASAIEVSSGDLETDYSNSSFTANIGSLDYSESYTLEGELVDNVAHNYSFSVDYTVEQEPEEDTSGGGGGGGGFTSSEEDEQDEPENDSEEELNQTGSTEQDNGTVNKTLTENRTASCEIVAARDNECRSFDRCSAPEGWEQVESCESWEEQRARELVNSLPDDGGKTVEEARAELENGNYSGAITKALEAKKAEEERKKTDNNGLDKVLPLAIAFTVLVAAGVLFRFYRRKKLVKEVEESSEELLNRLEKKESLSPQEEKKLAEVAEEIENENFEDAEESLEDINQ